MFNIMYIRMNRIREKSNHIFLKLICDGFYGERKQMSMAYRSICMLAIFSMHFRKHTHD
jgi:hypothetical protein